MKIADILRSLIDLVDAAESDEKESAKQPIIVNVNNGTAQVEEPRAEQEDDLEVMVPPLQQKIELLKKNAGLENVYDQQADEDEPLDS